MRLPLMQSQESTRRCGACTLCCTALAVPELEKPGGVPCQHLTPGGCGIYDDRPDSCRNFECAWLRGNGDLSVRPDRIGGVLHVEDGGHGPDGTALVIYTDPQRPLRWRRSAYVRRLIERTVKEGSGTFIVFGEQRKLITKPGSRLHKIIEAHTPRSEP